MIFFGNLITFFLEFWILHIVQFTLRPTISNWSRRLSCFLFRIGFPKVSFNSIILMSLPITLNIYLYLFLQLDQSIVQFTLLPSFLNMSRSLCLFYCLGLGFQFPLKSIPSLSLLVIHCILVVLSPFLGWYFLLCNLLPQVTRGPCTERITQ